MPQKSCGEGKILVKFPRPRIEIRPDDQLVSLAPRYVRVKHRAVRRDLDLGQV